MKFYRSILQLIWLLLIGWGLGFWAKSFDEMTEVMPIKTATIAASSGCAMAEHLTDGFAHPFVHEAIVSPTLSHQIPLSFFAIVATVWMLIDCASLSIQRSKFYYFFAWFRRLFGHQIAINAP